jgi:excisionase family DNA binding protein
MRQTYPRLNPRIRLRWGMKTPNDSRPRAWPDQIEEHGTSVKRLVTTRELARLLGVTTETIRHWARSGRIPCLRIGQKTIRFDRDSVLRAIQTEREPGGVA